MTDPITDAWTDPASVTLVVVGRNGRRVQSSVSAQAGDHLEVSRLFEVDPAGERRWDWTVFRRPLP